MSNVDGSRGRSAECLDENEAVSCAAGAGDLDERARWDAHLDGCDDCRLVVSRLAAAGPDARQPRHVAGQSIGRFELRQPVGIGAMGLVFEAFDPVLSRRVAIKLVRLDAVGDQRAAQDRLVRESRALAQLNHPNVVTIYDAGAHGDEIYFAMELVVGATVADWMATQRPWREVVDVFRQAGRGLAAAHAMGLVHRDVKPENMLRGEDGRVRIGDFGVVRHAGAIAERPRDAAWDLGDLELATRSGTVLGTPRYMAPEVRAGGRATAASDQWSFASSLWAALGGERTDPMRLSPGARRVPGWLRAIVARGLATDPEARWPSIDAMVHALGRRRRRAVWLGVGALATAALWIGVRAAQPVVDPCDEAPRALTGVWDPQRSLAVSRALLATGDAEAPAVATAVRRSLDDRVSDWLVLRRAVCRDPSGWLPGQPGVRAACLDRQLSVLRTTVDHLLAVRSGPALISALDVVQDLPRAEQCANVERLIKRVAGDFNGDGKPDVAIYGSGDSNWWFGLSDGAALHWGLAGNTARFGDLLMPSHKIVTGDFNGDGKTDVAIYGSGDGNWWFGLSDGAALHWGLAGNVSGFNDLLAPSRKILIGDFNGDGKTDVAFYYNVIGDWWFGLSDGVALHWGLAGNTARFGDLLAPNRKILLGDFNGDGKTDAAFYFNGDGNWWFGLSDGAALHWELAGNSMGYGNLLDARHKLFTGDFDGDGKADVAFYDGVDGTWVTGISDGTQIRWRPAEASGALDALRGPARRLVTIDSMADHPD